MKVGRRERGAWDQENEREDEDIKGFSHPGKGPELEKSQLEALLHDGGWNLEEPASIEIPVSFRFIRRGSPRISPLESL